MPEMEGVAFLGKAKEIYPEAKSILLTAYSDIEVAIKAINDVKLDYYLLKPWNPPEEKLYPVLNDMLYDWAENVRMPYDGIRVIGARWSPQSYAVKEFLSRNLVPYQWADIDTDGK
jgi:thioredoxin reductase (NADPH)